MSDNLLKFRIEQAKLIIDDCKYHIDTLVELIAREKKKLESKFKDTFNRVVEVSIKEATDEQLKARMNWYYYSKELIDTTAELRAKMKWVEEWESHIQKSEKEQTKQVSDKDINELRMQIINLPLKGKAKAEAQQIYDYYFDLGTKSASVEEKAQERYLYFDALKTFLQNNK